MADQRPLENLAMLPIVVVVSKLGIVFKKKTF